MASKEKFSQSILDSLIGYPISCFLRLINHSINFVICIIFFKQFRDTFLSWFKCNRVSSVPVNEPTANVKTISTMMSTDVGK